MNTKNGFLTCDIVTQRICWLRPVAVLMLAIASPLMFHRCRYVPAHVAMSPCGHTQHAQKLVQTNICCMSEKND